MVYIKHWSEFKAQALEVCKRDTSRTRLVVKARPKMQMLVVKVTNDYVTLKFRSKSTIILNRLDEFQREMFTIMSGVVPPEPVKEAQNQVAQPPQPQDPKAGGAKPDTQAGQAKSGGGKKKKGKRK